MEGINFFKYRCSFLTVLTVMISTLNSNTSVTAKIYMVGDKEEWNSQTNFGAWSEKYNFSVGDVIVFKYVKGQHNAYEVTEETYRSCDASSGVLAKYDSGEDRVELLQVKRYWFICNIEGHCLGGMRFGINVKETNANATDVAPTDDPSLNSSSTSVFQTSWTLIIIISFFILLVLLMMTTL